MQENQFALTQLKRLREWRRLTQEQLAELSGVKLTTIQKHERGVQNTAALDVAARLAHGLQVSIEALFTASVSNGLLEKSSAPLLPFGVPESEAPAARARPQEAREE